MRMIAVAAATLSCVALLAGCATRQLGDIRVHDEQMLRSIQAELPTKKGVWIRMGQPHRVSYSETDPNKSIWRYYHLSASRSGADWIPVIGIIAGGDNVQITENVIEFDGERSVKAEKLTYRVFKNDWAAISENKADDDPGEERKPVQAEMLKLELPFDPVRAEYVKNLEVYINEEHLPVH